MRTLLALLALLAFTTLAPPAPAQPALVQDLATTASGMGRGGEGPFVYVSLGDLREVSAADSASTAWDLAFRGTTILVNGGTSGPGAGAVVALDVPFEAVTALPADSLFLTDGQRPCPRGAALALCTGSGNGWYDYTPAGNLITPIEGRTLVVRRAGGGAAKVRIVSYYKGAPLAPGSTEPRYYTFEVEPLPAQ